MMYSGTNSSDEKKEMIDQTIKMIQDVVGKIQEACYVVIADNSGDSWGYDGKYRHACVQPCEEYIYK